MVLKKKAQMFVFGVLSKHGKYPNLRQNHLITNLTFPGLNIATGLTHQCEGTM
jgi:hypothetical protein